MKNLKYYAISMIICGCIGFVSGWGSLNYIKKSQRDDVFNLYTYSGLALGLIIGFVFMDRMLADDKVNEKRIETIKQEQDDKIEKEKYYGLYNVSTTSNQEKRKWNFESWWINPQTNNRNSIITKYNNDLKSVVSYINGTELINHQTDTGARTKVEDLHYTILLTVKKQITENTESNLLGLLV